MGKKFRGLTDQEMDALEESLPEPERSQVRAARQRLREMAENAAAGRGLDGGLTFEEIRRIYHDDPYETAEFACPYDGTELVAPWQPCPKCGRND